MARVTVENVTKIYPDKNGGAAAPAVDRVSFACEDGEFLVLLGPSGCGKTSTLRMIAGLEAISGGDISIGGKRVNDLAPRERHVAMAFENYALYPPLTVRDNILFPLKASGTPKAETEKRLREVVDILGIENILDRHPAELSGGQQQRISLGRCIIRDADVYLMDEPLSHLDAELRLHTRGELKRIHAIYKRTVIYVTHDQIEALALADRIVVMANGRIQQIGTPEDVYERPANLFVAGFIGEPPMNLVAGVSGNGDAGSVFQAQEGDFRLRLPEALAAVARAWAGKGLVLGIRPHHIRLGRRGDRVESPGTVVLYESLGEEGVLEVEVQGCPFTALTEPELRLRPGEQVEISFAWDKASLFDPESGRSILVTPHS